MLVFLLASSCLALEYSADRLVTLKNNKKVESKVYYSDNKYRVVTEEKAGTVVLIYRFEKMIWWNLMANMKSYYENKIPEGWFGLVECNQIKPSGKPLAQEEINGDLCDKYMVYPDPKKKKLFVYMWVSRKHKMVVKTQVGDGSYMSELKNISIGKQDPLLFEVPKGYKPFSLKWFLK